MDFGLDVEVNDLIALEGGDDCCPRHFGDAHLPSVSVGEDGDGE